MPEYIRWLEPLLSFPQIIIVLSIIFLLFLIFGRFTLKIFRVERYLSSNFAVNIPIYGAAGFLFVTLVLNIIGIFFIGTYSLIILLIITASSIFALMYLGDFSLIVQKAKNLNLSLRSLFNTLVPLILILLTLYHFSEVIEVMGWPNIGDVARIHGPFTSILLYNGKITLNLEPVSSSLASYPMGFHVVSANFAAWFNLFPGEAVFLLGGIITILIPLLIYSLTYIITKSIPLSLLTYSATFIIHPSRNMERYLIGYFYNGPYSNLAGFLILIFSICILSLEYAQPEKLKKQELYVGSILTLLLSFLALILIYPSFTIFVAIIIIFILVKHYQEIVTFIRKKPISVFPPLVYGLLFMFIPNSYVYTFSQTNIYTQVITNVYVYSGYTVSPTFLFDHITGYVMLIALPISIVLFFRKKYSLLALLYILFFCIIFSTLSPAAPSILYIILPGRALMIPWIMSWLILALGFAEVMRIRRVKKFFNSYINISILLTICIIILISLPQFTSSLVQEFSYTEAKTWAWYSYQNSFPYDYAGLLWINYNIPTQDLILTDQTWASYWILSFSAKNITVSFLMNSDEIKRAKELLTIWNKPYENDTVYQLLQEYNVSYIFVTSDWGYYPSTTLAGGPTGYRTKPFTPSEYVSIFDTYTFLKIAFRSGFTTVYKVEID